MEIRKDGALRRIPVIGSRVPGLGGREAAPPDLPGVWLREATASHPNLERHPAYIPLNDVLVRNLYTRPFIRPIDPQH